MLHQTLPILGQLWQLFEVSQILEFLRYLANPLQRLLLKASSDNIWASAVIIHHVTHPCAGGISQHIHDKNWSYTFQQLLVVVPKIVHKMLHISWNFSSSH